ncbi:hypothetical protein ACSBR2_009204 [Camellia fascicularis]
MKRDELSRVIKSNDEEEEGVDLLTLYLNEEEIKKEKIREELKSNIPTKEANKWRLFSIEEVSKLIYLHSALCEALRLYPPVPFQHKKPLKPNTLPSGHCGEDCVEFKPERWLSERGTIKHEPSYKFLAFNARPRTCLGKEVAFTQMKAVSAAIIHNYNVRVVEGHPVVPNASIILCMKHGLTLIFEEERGWKRESSVRERLGLLMELEERGGSRK